jgi:uncharacterized membrane protein
LLAILSAALLWLAQRDARYLPVAALASLLVALLVGGWVPASAADAARLVPTVVGFGALFAVGSLGLGLRAARPARWAALAAAAPVALAVAGYVAGQRADLVAPWGALAIAHGAALVAMAAFVAPRRAGLVGGDAVLAYLAAGATAFLAAAVPLELDRAWIAVAWALQALALAWIAGRLGTPELRWLIYPLAGMVALRLVDPAVAAYPIGRLPIANWLAYGYGVPAASFGTASWLARRSGDRPLARVLEALALAIVAGWIGLAVHHAFHPGRFAEADVPLGEHAALILAWLGYALVLDAAGRRWPGGLRADAAVLMAFVAALALVAGPLTSANPLLTGVDVGARPIANRLMPAYGATGALLLILAHRLRARGPGGQRTWYALGSLGLASLFAYVNLEVRRAFHGARLDLGATPPAEQYAYSVAWLLFAGALLAVGIVWRGRLARVASLAAMMLAVGKVFLVDMADLAGLYRVLSFLGLGISLLLVAHVYQRYVFGTDDDRPVAPPGDEPDAASPAAESAGGSAPDLGSGPSASTAGPAPRDP